MEMPWRNSLTAQETNAEAVVLDAFEGGAHPEKQGCVRTQTAHRRLVARGTGHVPHPPREPEEMRLAALFGNALRDHTMDRL